MSDQTPTETDRQARVQQLAEEFLAGTIPCPEWNMCSLVRDLLSLLAESDARVSTLTQELDDETKRGNYREQVMFECAQSWERRARTAEAERDTLKAALEALRTDQA